MYAEPINVPGMNTPTAPLEPLGAPAPSPMPSGETGRTGPSPIRTDLLPHFADIPPGGGGGATHEDWRQMFATDWSTRAGCREH
jgi:hypothetical protein